MTHLGRAAPGRVHHIDYAAMVGDPEPHLRGALAHLGLDWDPAVLEFHQLDRVVRTPSSEQVRSPPTRDGMEVWRPYAEWLGPRRDKLHIGMASCGARVGHVVEISGVTKK